MIGHDAPRAIRIAILAMGGEGGGVLADWIVDLGERNGHVAQMTSVPGVAQRTGATVYYVELFPESAIPPDGSAPVLALMPVPGDVDVVVCSELMEAARAIQRGFVTPDRTTLVTSTHRVFAMTEKIALADGRVEPSPLLESCAIAAKQLIAFDMAAAAERTGSVISAVMFGALARSEALPFSRAQFEETIERGGIGVAPSLKAFAAGFDGPPPAMDAAPKESGDETRQDPDDLREAEAWIPDAALPIVRTGFERLVDYQDRAYAQSYLGRLRPVAEAERLRGDGSCRLTTETARQLALAMAYEDTIRVAELKIRRSRFDRVRQEVKVKDGQILEISEYMHPRLQEIAETLPAPIGRLLLRAGPARSLVEALTRKGRVVKTSSISGFLTLYAVAALKPWRSRSLRFPDEQAQIEAWLGEVLKAAEHDYALAVEIAETRNLVKGYGDTHARGRASYDAIIALLPSIGRRPDAAGIVRSLRQAASADDTGKALAEAIARISAPASEPPRADRAA
jgi:indolepyruvate ferredoxin oxidoreductase beta subunit